MDYGLFNGGCLRYLCIAARIVRRDKVLKSLFYVFLPLNIFIPYLVDLFVDFGIDSFNNELKYSSETSVKRGSTAIVSVFKAGAFRY